MDVAIGRSRLERIVHTQARTAAWVADFVAWHNEAHYHSGVGLHHPAYPHDSSATAIHDIASRCSMPPEPPTPNGSPDPRRTTTTRACLDQQARISNETRPN